MVIVKDRENQRLQTSNQFLRFSAGVKDQFFRLLSRFFKSNRLVPKAGFAGEIAPIPHDLPQPVSGATGSHDTTAISALAATERAPVALHQTRVDLIICVRSPLDVVKRFLQTLMQYTSRPYALIVVDDGNHEETRIYLTDFALAEGAMLLRNDRATGFASAAVLGLRHSNADYVVILNSDVEVSAEWLERMMACAVADERIGLVGPLSNYEPQHSLPEELQVDGRAAHPLPTEALPCAMAALYPASNGLYPRLPFLPGFCLLIKRTTINEIGYFDEASFGEWFQGEHDYRLRASQAGWQLALANDVYVSYCPTKQTTRDVS